MKKIFVAVLLICSVFQSVSFAQYDYIPVNNPVYKYLYRYAVLGKLPGYNPVILPKTRKELAENFRQLLNNPEFKDREQALSLYNDILELSPDSMAAGINLPLFLRTRPAHPFAYSDSLVSASLDAVLSAEHISYKTDNGNETAQLFTYGAAAVFSFPYNIGVVARAWNGSVYGSRDAAHTDYRVARSFTFNATGLNNFDGTDGYITFHSNLLTLQFGRDKLIRGMGYINPVRFGYDRPQFDFFRAMLHYKQFSYEFVHGWLNEKPIFTEVGGVNYKTKLSKYLASAYAVWRPSDIFSLSMSQTIIYHERGLEAAYMNPFIMWESAQRSLNDVDNSYLSLETEYRPLTGLRFYYQMMMDDINFNVYNKEGFNSVSNMGLYQAGVTYSHPEFPVTVAAEFMEIRPFVFSHPGHLNGLSYTNNAEGLGVQFQPNSRVFSASMDMSIATGVTVTLNGYYYLHGRNRYDSSGNRIENVGGEITVPYDLTIKRLIPTLAGERETTLSAGGSVHWQYSYNLSASFESFYKQIDFRGKTSSVTTHLKLMYGWR